VIKLCLFLLDAVITALECSGSGQNNIVMGRVPKPTTEWDSKPNDVHEPKGKNKRKWKPKITPHAGEGLLVEMGRGCVGHAQAQSNVAGSTSSTKNPGRGSGESGLPPQPMIQPAVPVPITPGACSDGTGDPVAATPAAKGLPGESGSLTGEVGGTEVEVCSRNSPTTEVAKAGSSRRSSGCTQTLPVGVNAGREVTGVLPARREDVFHGEKGLLARPNCSWVAGRTGFGPVGTGKVSGLPQPAETPAGHSDLVVYPQPEDQATLDRLGESELGTKKTVLEIYHRRTDKIIEAAAEDVGLEDGMEMSFVEETMEVTGDVEGTLEGASPATILKRKGGVVIEDSADSPVTKDLKLAMVVGGVTGVSGQEDLKMGCLKKIIVDKHGERGDSNCEGSQQEVESLVQERGNSSDYEA
jgi:hypothetical protein